LKKRAAARLIAKANNAPARGEGLKAKNLATIEKRNHLLLKSGQPHSNRVEPVRLPGLRASN
jgi:hypothetical protein